MSKRRRSSGGGGYAIAPVYMVTIAFAVVLTLGLALLLVFRVGLSGLASYLISINTTTFLAYAYDKASAGGDRQRVPERVLHGLAFAGGTPAALLAQLLLRHKTQKSSFRVWFWVIAWVQVLLLAAWLWFRSR